MLWYKYFLVCLIVLSSFLDKVQTVCKFTNINCETYNKSIVEFKHCYIKAVARNDNYINIHAKIKDIGRTAVVSVRLMKRANGWKPFLYNITMDGCKFLKNPKSNPLGNFFFNNIKEYVNFNHSCPYDHDIILEKFRILDSVHRLPFPAGEYAVDTMWKVNNIYWGRINGSCSFNPVE